MLGGFAGAPVVVKLPSEPQTLPVYEVTATLLADHAKAHRPNPSLSTGPGGVPHPSQAPVVLPDRPATCASLTQ